MNLLSGKTKGILLCLAISIPAWLLGKMFPLIGGAVFSILIGMLVTNFISDKAPFEAGIRFTSKKVLQWAVILLGFGLNLSVIIQTGRESLPIIVSTIAVSLLTAYVLHRSLKIPANTSVLVGVGSSICGGSAIAAAAPVIEASDKEVAQSISIVFFFNVLAALVFPMLGTAVGFDQASGYACGVFAGTAVNDTSSVTATAATWDSMFHLGSQTLDTAVTVKLTRTLAIIPICVALACIFARRKNGGENKVSIKNIFPMFILYFIGASIITTVAISQGVSADVFKPVKELSKFFIVLAMAAIGLNTNLIQLIRTGGRPICMGLCCWLAITAVSLVMQYILGIW